MSEIDRFMNQPVNWLRATGPESDVVISSRLRMARNLAVYPFLSRLAGEQRDAIRADIEQDRREGFVR